MSQNLFHVIVCAAITNNTGKVLIARRKADKKLGGFWEFPGGKLEPGEDLEPALKRELREELDVSINVRTLLHVKPHVYPHGNVLILFYLCDSLSGDIKLTDHDEIRWCTVAELRELKLLPANAEALEKLERLLRP